jgi:hypothetical protein
MAGLRGPERNELDQLYAPPAELAPGKAGDVIDATGGRIDFPGVSPEPPNDCSNGFGSNEKGL